MSILSWCADVTSGVPLFVSFRALVFNLRVIDPMGVILPFSGGGDTLLNLRIYQKMIHPDKALFARHTLDQNVLEN